MPGYNLNLCKIGNSCPLASYKSLLANPWDIDWSFGGETNRPKLSRTSVRLQQALSMQLSCNVKARNAVAFRQLNSATIYFKRQARIVLHAVYWRIPEILSAKYARVARLMTVTVTQDTFRCSTGCEFAQAARSRFLYLSIRSSSVFGTACRPLESLLWHVWTCLWCPGIATAVDFVNCTALANTCSTPLIWPSLVSKTTWPQLSRRYI